MASETDGLIANVSEEQRKVFRQHFDNFDPNGDGMIPAPELGTVLRACGQIPTESWLKEREQLADPGKKGFVEWEGFVKILNQCMSDGNPDDDLLDAFRRFDPGATGFITCAELRKIMTSLGEVLNDEEVDEMLKDGDPLGNGVVNYEALARCLKYGPD